MTGDPGLEPKTEDCRPTLSSSFPSVAALALTAVLSLTLTLTLTVPLTRSPAAAVTLSGRL